MLTRQHPLACMQVTRFAGKVREMGRMLRLKSDLQHVVISADYANQTFRDIADDNNPDTDADAQRVFLGPTDHVKTIILDENNFWKPLVEALKVMTPIVKLLRLSDGTAPVMGKILPRMEGIRQKIMALDISWKSEALRAHDYRWEYIKSPMHFAATCLDPEFLMREMDEAMQDGLISVSERLCLRSEMQSLQAKGCAAQAAELKITSHEVQERMAATMMELSSYQEKEGIFSKPFVQNNAEGMPPSTWWGTYGKGLPLLSGIARTVLSQPVCASAAGYLDLKLIT